MKPNNNALYTAEQTRHLDQIAIDDYAIPGYTLMCRAGEFAFDTLMSEFDDTRLIVVVCGIGNNGGDGYVLARLARRVGIAVRVLQLGDLNKQKGDALQARKDLEAEGIIIENFSSDKIQAASIVVDAIFGTGLQRDIEGLWKNAIEAINSAAKPVMAMDIPSGLHADNGRIQGVAVRARVTTSFIGVKRGLYTAWGPELCGEIRFCDLNVPSEIYYRIDSQSCLWDQKQLVRLNRRARNSHKGHHGHVLLVGGDLGMSGAIRMAGEACLRSGSGLVSIVTRESHAAMIAQARPELMCHGIESTQALEPLLDRANVIAIGPGLGQTEWAQGLFKVILKQDMPKIIDADALNLLSLHPQYRDDWILTPHPGEAARLLSCKIEDIEADRFAACEALHNTYGGVCVLKGAGSIIYDGQQHVICNKGNPGMACGGSGDVLTGILAALVAQFSSFSLFDLAQLGTGLHAIAGDQAACRGERGMIASDIVAEIRGVLNSV